jgi:hypothetical protein
MVRSPPPLSVSGSSGSNTMHMPLTPRTRKALTHNPFLMLGLLALIAIGMAALCLVVLNSIGLFVLDELRMLVLALAGVAGAILMFVADLVLYYSKVPSERTARVYFASIDPNGDRLAESPMADIPPERMMLGGVLGPIAAALYTLGFTQLYFGLVPDVGAFLPAIAAVGLSLMMIIGGVYHALFPFTGFLAKACRDASAKSPLALPALTALVETHRRYLLYVYRWAAPPAIIGSLAFAWCVATRVTAYHTSSIILAPAFSAPLKLLLKRFNIGSVVLVGGLTNLWNLAFFCTLVWSALHRDAARLFNLG